MASGDVPLQAVVLGTDGRPASGVNVEIQWPIARGSDFAPIRGQETDADGRFRESLPPGRYDLRFTSGRMGLFVPGFLVDGAAADVSFTLHELARVEVEVVRGEAPLAGTMVLLRHATAIGLLGLAAPTGADGKTVVEEVPHGPYVLEVRTQGQVQAQRALDVRGDVAVRVPMPDVAVLEGRVRDGSGVGIAGAHLRVETRVRGDGVETTLSAEAHSEADGSFRLWAPRHPLRLIAVEAEGHAPWPTPDALGPVLASIRGLAKGEPVVLDVPLSQGTSITGRATDETGAPVPGVVLRFTDVRGRAIEATTAEDGRYVAEHANPGAWSLAVPTEGWFPAGRFVANVPADGSAVTLDVALVRARVLEGTVVQTEGAPAAGARVYVAGDGGMLRSARDARRDLETFADGSGVWRLEDVPAHRDVWLRASLGPLEAAPVFAPRRGTGSLRLVLAPTGTIRGDVVDLATRERVPGATVRLDPIGDPPVRGSHRLTTDAEGAFVAPGLLAGEWQLVGQRGQDYLQPGEPVKVTLARDAPEVTAEVRLDPGLVFAGVVRDERGAAISDATVRVEGVPDGGQPVNRWARTSLRGEFRITGFRAGSYRSTARAPGHRPAVLQPLRGGEQTLRFVLVAAP
jgi:hypothetical protein